MLANTYSERDWVNHLLSLANNGKTKLTQKSVTNGAPIEQPITEPLPRVRKRYAIAGPDGDDGFGARGVA